MMRATVNCLPEQGLPPEAMQATETIKFARNWNNKLYCRCFTTIRLDSAKWQVGKYFMVVTPNGPAFRAVIREKVTRLLIDLPAVTVAVDLGMSVLEGKKAIQSFYPDTNWSKQPVAILLLENLEYSINENF